jgi:hypothetical protein
MGAYLGDLFGCAPDCSNRVDNYLFSLTNHIRCGIVIKTVNTKLQKRRYHRLYMRRWRKLHPRRSRAYGRISDSKPSRIRKKRLWQRRNKDKVRKYQLRWKRKHPRKHKANIVKGRHIRRARLAKAKGSFTLSQFRTLCKSYQYSCIRCGRNERQLKRLRLVLSPDHIKPIAIGGSNDIKNIQPLCHTLSGGKNSCNQKKKTKHIDYRNSPLALSLLNSSRLCPLLGLCES